MVVTGASASAHCGARHMIQGFNDSLYAELLHDRSNVRLTMVNLPTGPSACGVRARPRGADQRFLFALPSRSLSRASRAHRNDGAWGQRIRYSCLWRKSANAAIPGERRLARRDSTRIPDAMP